MTIATKMVQVLHQHQIQYELSHILVGEGKKA